jgi:hypothetical protein
MWMLLAVNAVMLAGLLFTLWRLHHLQTVLAVQEPTVRVAARQPLTPSEPQRPERARPRRSALDEFPSESTLDAAIAPLPPRRPRPSNSRPSHRLAPVGR